MAIVSNKLTSIYNKSPIFIQHIMTSMQGYIFKKQRYGKTYRKYLKELKSKDFSNFKINVSEQNFQLKKIVDHAYKKSLFYSHFYQNIDISQINTVEDLKKMPIVSKEMIRQNINQIYTINSKGAIGTDTSGTTGTTIRYLATREDMQKRMAYLDYFKWTHGFIGLKMKRASFGASKVVPPNSKKHIYYRNNISIKQRVYSAQYSYGNHLPHIVKSLNKWKPHSLDGLPSAIYAVAQYIVDNNISMKYKPIAIFPTAEKLLPHYRQTIEQAFKCPVRDQYSSSEGAPFIVECKAGNMHYSMDTDVIETDDDDNAIVTCFFTYGSPLIRFQIGDKIKINYQTKCQCGNSMPVVTEIIGRSNDYLLSLSNKKVSSLFMSLVSGKFNNSIKNMQFHQYIVNEVEVWLEVDKLYKPEMNQIIIDKLHYSLGEKMNVIIKVVDEIPRNKSGKFRYIINKLDKGG